MRDSPHFKLSPPLLTGVADIDSQHSTLVNIRNEAADKLSASPSPKTADRLTRDLLAYAIYHFETEERLIHQSGYDLAEAAATARHLKEHRQFSENIVALRAGFRHDAARAAAALLAFLDAWLPGHILHSDRQLADFINARRPAPAADGHVA